MSDQGCRRVTDTLRGQQDKHDDADRDGVSGEHVIPERGQNPDKPERTRRTDKVLEDADAADPHQTSRDRDVETGVPPTNTHPAARIAELSQLIHDPDGSREGCGDSRALETKGRDRSETENQERVEDKVQ